MNETGYTPFPFLISEHCILIQVPSSQAGKRMPGTLRHCSRPVSR